MTEIWKPTENISHGFTTGLIPPMTGEHNLVLMVKGSTTIETNGVNHQISQCIYIDERSRVAPSGSGVE